MSNLSVTTTIRPGLLVGLKTQIKGNVSHKRGSEIEHKTDSGASKSKWETERTILDPVEQEEAVKVRGKARGLIEAVCTKSEFGLLCPTIAAPDLDNALVEAARLCAEFNQRAKKTKIRFAAITGKIAQDDLQAARAIRKEISELIGDMKDGLEQLDIETVRSAASRAKQLGQMLTPEAEAKVRVAIDQARSLARKIVAAGEQGAGEIDKATIARLTEARTSFLDFDAVGEVASPFIEGRAVDLNVAPDSPGNLFEARNKRELEL